MFLRGGKLVVTAKVLSAINNHQKATSSSRIPTALARFPDGGNSRSVSFPLGTVSGHSSARSYMRACGWLLHSGRQRLCQVCIIDKTFEEVFMGAAICRL